MTDKPRGKAYPTIADDDDTARRLFTFDPTVHMGHIITAVAVIGSAAIMWGTTISDIKALKDDSVKHEAAIAAAVKKESDDYAQTQNRIDATLGQLRTEMNAWFMRIDQKIDQKADKR